MIKIFFVIILCLVDFFSKRLVFQFIDLNNFIEITQFFNLAHIHNYGISFGLFSGFFSPWIFILLALTITAIIFYMMINTDKKFEKWGYLFIISGALSNIIDRLINGYVIDFIYIHFRSFYWPAFNMADIYITIGIFIILLQLLNDLNKRLIK